MALQIHEDFDRYYEHGFRIGLIDYNLDPIMSDTFHRTFPCQLFVLDNDTKKAYSWEFDRMPNDTFEWVTKKMYRNSAYQFKIPRTLYNKEHVLFLYWKAYRELFKITVAYRMDEYMGALFAINPNFLIYTPLSYIADWDGNDIFEYKLVRKLGVCICTILLFIYILL